MHPQPYSGETTSPTLLTRLRDRSDAEAWAIFARTYRDLITRFCRRRGLQFADADDVFQRVLLKLMKGLPGFEYDQGRGRFRDYLFRCVRSAICDVTRCPAVMVGAVSLNGSEAADSATGDDDHRVWEVEWVDHHYRIAIGRLRQRVSRESIEILEASIAGQAPRTIARSMGISEEAVYKTLQRMRARLRGCIEQQVSSEEVPDHRGV